MYLTEAEVFYKKIGLKNFAKFTGRNLCRSLFFSKVAGLRPKACNFTKKESPVQVFPVKFAKLLKTPFFDLIDKDLCWEIITTETVSNEASENQKKAFKKREIQALAGICLATATNLQIYVRSAKTAKQTCDNLERLFQRRSSRPQMFFKIGLFKNFAIFTKKHQCCSLFFNKVARPATLLKKDSNTGVFL